MVERYSSILFDLDHTLLDSAASEAAAFDITLRNAGVDEPTAHFAVYDGINKALWDRVEQGELSPDHVKIRRFSELIDAVGIMADPDLMAADFVEGLAQNGELYPGTIESLKALAGRADLALITNGLSFVQRTRIDRLGLGPYFKAVSISDEVGSSKPGTEIFDHVFEQLASPDREATLIVGDSLSSDIQGGINYGITTCWFNPHGLRDPAVAPTHTIASSSELLPLT